MSRQERPKSRLSKLLAPFSKEFEARDHLVGAGLGAAYTAWLLATARSLGFARDEGFYFRAATDYARWFRLLFEHGGKAFERGAIDSSWATNHEHPSLMKSLFALSWMYLHEKWKIIADASTSYRLPTMVFAGIALWLTYVMTARIYSRRAGVFAACGLALMPAVFYNAHLACFDVPIMTMWLASVYAYHRAEVKGGFKWAILAGVVYGLTLETKHNAWLLPAVFLGHGVVLGATRMLRKERVQGPWSILAMASVGPAVFYALWPWIWNDTGPRLQEYVNFHLHHEYYNMEFLGVNYFGPPSPKGYVPVMIVATVPLVTLLLFVVGFFERLRIAGLRTRALVGKVSASVRAPAHPPPEDTYQTDVLLFLALVVPVAAFFRPTTPIFGGTKHWLPAYPFLVMFAGRGLDLVARAMERALEARGALRRAPAANVLLLATVLLAPLAITADSHPFGLSTYTPVVGGTAGGADLGLNRQFWGFTTQSLAPYFAAKAPRGASVFIHDTAWDAWARMLEEGRLRSDLRGVGSPSEADFAIVHHELHMAEVDHQIWVAYGHDAPDYVLTHDGVPIISVYRR
jgi:Dolichyl-phosphate-mannose-protein mannosyltransferase